MPVHRLLGGPTRTELPGLRQHARLLARARAAAPARARRLVEQGYQRDEVVLPPRPDRRPRGDRARTSSWSRTLREAVGPDVDIMLDAWMSWDVPYTVEMAERLAEYQPALDRGAGPARQDRQLRRDPPPLAGARSPPASTSTPAGASSSCSTPTRSTCSRPTSTGRRHHRDAQDLRARLGLRPCPSSRTATRPCTNAHLIAAQTPVLCPLARVSGQVEPDPPVLPDHPLEPVNGMITVPDRPGMGIELDPAKIEEEQELRW